MRMLDFYCSQVIQSFRAFGRLTGRSVLSSHLAPAPQLHTPHPSPGAGGLGGGGAPVEGGAGHTAPAPHCGDGGGAGDHRRELFNIISDFQGRGGREGSRK